MDPENLRARNRGLIVSYRQVSLNTGDKHSFGKIYRKEKIYGNDTVGDSHFAARWRPADLAIQLRLGFLSERRSGTRFIDLNHFAGHGTHIRIFAPKTPEFQKAH